VLSKFASIKFSLWVGPADRRCGQPQLRDYAAYRTLGAIGSSRAYL
jgi:hypothetical protein